MKKAVIIPIYLRFNTSEELRRSEGLRFGKRAIESLKLLEDQEFTLILPVCLDRIVENREGSFAEADQFLREELKKVGLPKSLLFSSQQLNPMKDYFRRNKFLEFCTLIDLKGFPKIRNTGLLLAQALSMDVVIFIDSDEVVEDPHYVKVACEYLDQVWNGKVVSGKGGFYVNSDGTILLPPQRLWWRFLWNKTRWMNEIWKAILSSNVRLVSSPMILGGNLVLHRRLFTSVPFDPYISRGEDTDYLINAARFDFVILFDKELRIKHLHPKRDEVFFQEELRGDIERFLYEREKTKAGVGISLEPYPGYFLKWTLYPRSILTSLFLSLDYGVRGEWKKAMESMATIASVFRKKRGGWLDYLRFQRDWKRAMEEIDKEGMEEVLKNCWV